MRTKRIWLIVGVVAAIVVAIGVYLLVDRPWESEEYKDCVRHAQNIFGKDFETSELEDYCRQIFS